MFSWGGLTERALHEAIVGILSIKERPYHKLSVELFKQWWVIPIRLACLDNSFQLSGGVSAIKHE